MDPSRDFLIAFLLSCSIHHRRGLGDGKEGKIISALRRAREMVVICLSNRTCKNCLHRRFGLTFTVERDILIGAW